MTRNPILIIVLTCSAMIGWPKPRHRIRDCTSGQRCGGGVGGAATNKPDLGDKNFVQDVARAGALLLRQVVTLAREFFVRLRRPFDTAIVRDAFSLSPAGVAHIILISSVVTPCSALARGENRDRWVGTR